MAGLVAAGFFSCAVAPTENNTVAAIANKDTFNDFIRYYF
jgi:hypothetical protein